MTKHLPALIAFLCWCVTTPSAPIAGSGSPHDAAVHASAIPADPLGAEVVPEPCWVTRATVTNVVDGDTIDVEIRRTIRVRLLDCWAPETHLDQRLPESQRAAEKQAGLKSREALENMALGKSVIVQVPTSEDLLKSTTMGRVLGRVWLEGDEESLSQKQVKSGNATKQKREELK